MKEFGEKIGNIDKSTISIWEKGKYKPSQANLIKISKLSNVSVGWILYGELESYIELLINENNNKVLSSQELTDVINQIEKIKGDPYELAPIILTIMYPNIKLDVNKIKLFKEMTYTVKESSEYKLNILPLLEYIYRIDEKEIENIKFELINKLKK